MANEVYEPSGRVARNVRAVAVGLPVAVAAVTIPATVVDSRALVAGAALILGWTNLAGL